jgi:hypothetical protein
MSEFDGGGKRLIEGQVRAQDLHRAIVAHPSKNPRPSPVCPM